jgi:hypothetical protein
MNMRLHDNIIYMIYILLNARNVLFHLLLKLVFILYTSGYFEYVLLIVFVIYLLEFILYAFVSFHVCIMYILTRSHEVNYSIRTEMK